MVKRYSEEAPKTIEELFAFMETGRPPFNLRFAWVGRREKQVKLFPDRDWWENERDKSKDSCGGTSQAKEIMKILLRQVPKEDREGYELRFEKISKERAYKWKATVDISLYGIDQTLEVDFPIPQYLFNKIQKAVNSGVVLKNCDFYEDLKKRVSGGIDWANLLGIKHQLPRRQIVWDPYEKREYNEKMDAFEKLYLEKLEGVKVKKITVFDPNEQQ